MRSLVVPFKYDFNGYDNLVLGDDPHSSSSGPRQSCQVCPVGHTQVWVLYLAVKKIASPAAGIRLKFLSYRLESKGIKVRQFR